MCRSCYEERGNPKIINDNVLKAAKAIDELYELCLSGGGAHIVTDDWNLEDSNIELCIKHTNEQKGEMTDEEAAVAIECLEAMKILTEDERATALALSSGYIEPGNV